MKTLLIAIGLFIATSVNAENGLVVKKSKETVNIQFASKNEGWATLQIKDNSGEVVLEQQMVVAEGSNTVPVFFVSKLKKGTYTFELTIEDKVQTSKFIKG